MMALAQRGMTASRRAMRHTGTTSVSTRAASRAPVSSTTSTCTSFPLGWRHQLHARPRRHPRDEPDPRGQLRDGARGLRLTMAISSPPAGIFKAYDIRGIYGEELDAETAHLIGRAFARVLAETPGQGRLRAANRAGPRHAPQRPGDGRRRPPGPGRGGRHRDRRRAGRDGDALLPGRLARARRRRDGHRLAQPEGLHGREAAARGRPGAVGRRRDPGRPRRDRGRAAATRRVAARSRRSTSTPTSTSTSSP